MRRLAVSVASFISMTMTHAAHPVADWKAGAASVVITPEQPMWMSGYASRNKPADGKFTELWAKALVVEDPQGTRAALISLDLVGISRALSTRIADRVYQKLGIPREAVQICTSHTHSGPVIADNLAPMYGLSPDEHDKVVTYTRNLEDKIVSVVETASERSAPARLAWTNGKAEFAVNRRNNPEPKVPELRSAGQLKGPVDHDVPVLRVTALDGRVRALVFGYACHCTVLSGYEWCGDYAGFAQLELERTHPGATALFFAGCGADQNPLPRRTVELARQYGIELAAAVTRAIAGPMQAIDGRLAIRYGLVDLPFDTMPTKSEIERQASGSNVYEQRRARVLLAEIARAGQLAPAYPYPVQVWRLGPQLTWIALGGEVVVDYSIRLKREMGARNTWVAGYANDVMAYIPSQRVLEEGGYEGAGAMVYYGLPTRWAPTVESKIVAKVHQLLREIDPTHELPALTTGLAEQLPRIPATAAADALQTFRIQDGFRMELVASEPLVLDPIDMAFDENGRLWVVEMIDYPFGPKEQNPPQGRIRVLDDANGDGRMDSSHVFAEGLAWPTALALWDGGVFVAAAPDILYLKDTDGDHVADRKEVVFAGFGVANVQALVNNIKWGVDNWFYGASGGNGGDIRSTRRSAQPAVTLRGRDFQFRPDGEFRAISGGGQFGHTLDDFGRRFVCSNSNHARHVVLESNYLARNPGLSVPAVLQSIASDGDAAPVFRLSPPEPWRVVRTRMRIAGQVPGPVEHGGRVTGYFTSATGITVYRGNALGDAYYGNLFIGDVASNLVHRKTLAADGVSFGAHRAERDSEFIASTDNWFRPVNFANGPDGALYICDMYRECIEHPLSIPDFIKAHLDLTSGKDRGRIWRVVRTGTPAYRPPALGSATTAELVAALQNRDAWWRETAARLLYQRQDAAAIPTLESVAQHDRPEVAVAALWALDGLKALSPQRVLAALGSPHAAIREQAVRLAESRFDNASLPPAVWKLASDSSPRVRMQVAYSAGAVSESASTHALATIGLKDGRDPWIRAAILSSIATRDKSGGNRSLSLLRELHASAPNATAIAPELSAELLQQVGSHGALGDWRAALEWIATTLAPESETSWDVLRGLGEGMPRDSRSLARLFVAPPDEFRSVVAALKPALDAATRTTADASAPEARRLSAARVLAHAPLALVQSALTGLLTPKHSQALQIAAVRSLAAHDEPEAAAALLAPWATYSTPVRREVLESVFRRTQHVSVLLDRVQSGSVRRGDLELDRRKQLLAHPNLQIRERALKSLGDVSSDRTQVLSTYRAALVGPAQADRGKAVFQKHCVTCHRMSGQGSDVGPDLATVRERTADALLEQILDPNREVNPAYVNYTLATTDGRILTGLIASETESSVTLKRAESATDVVPRLQIDELQSTGLSLMPEGVEKDITPAQLADVIAYLRRGD